MYPFCTLATSLTLRFPVGAGGFGTSTSRGPIHNAGYSGRTLGENIAWGSLQYSTPASIVKMWMHSPGHRANILRAGFRDIGIGIARGAPQAGVHGAATYTTDFGTPR